MRVLVTGGAGYVGSVSVRLLLQAGHEVVVLDTLERGHREAVDDRADFVLGDVGDADAVREALCCCDAVLHCAGYIDVAESVRDPEAYFENNASKPAVLLEQMRIAGVDALVFSSTAAVYGEPDAVPIPEDAPCRPVNPYGESKLRFEQAIAAASQSWGLRAVVFRYFNVAGAWPDGSLGEAHEPETHIIPRVLGVIRDGVREFEIYGRDYPTPDGTCIRDYIHVCDLADAHARGLERLAAGKDGCVCNLGTGKGWSNLEVVQACARTAGVSMKVTFGPRRPGDPAVLVAGSDRARALLGWRPRRSDLGTIVEDAWRWERAGRFNAGRKGVTGSC
ncbi:MAG: UDP-glucose 4-epimerase GalE [Anaerosomatales bacterium]|nr:UDP-glucose 4-epimerase GalE [Anaerosomatales bacterium]